MAKKQFIRVADAAAQLNVSPWTIRNYCNDGRLKYDTNPAGQRVFKQIYIDEFLGKNIAKTYAFYVRDSGASKEALQHQIDKLTQTYGEPVVIYSDGASGLNENRPGLTRLIKQAHKGEYNTLAITAKDRLTRFGYTFIEQILNDHGITIVVFDDDKEKSLQDELMQDFMSLIASFSGKFYKLRGIEQRKRLLEAAEEELNKQ